MRANPRALGAVAALTTALSGVGASQERPVARQPSVITGCVTVRDEPGAGPIRRARITVRGGGLPQAAVTDTDTSGCYRLTLPSPGTYRITAEKAGFVSLAYGATTPSGAGTAVSLERGERAVIDLALPRGAALEGRIFDEQGEPLQDAEVSALRVSYGQAGRRATATRQTTTDDLGRFRLHSLPGGTYYIAARAARTASAIAAMRSDGRPAALETQTFYPGTPSAGEAQPIVLRTAEEISGFDIRLIRVVARPLEVTVRDSSGGTARRVTAWLRPVGASFGGTSGFGGSRSGVIFFPPVSPGEYWLSVTVTTSTPRDREFALTRMRIGEDDPGAVTVRTEPGARLEGRIEAVEGELPANLSRVRIAAHAPDSALQGLVEPVSTLASADGRFALAQVFGPRIFHVAHLPDRWAVSDVLLDGTNVTFAAPDIRSTSVARAVRIRVTDRTASLSITLGEGRAGADVRVVVFRADQPGALLPGVGRSRAVGADADGRFAIPALLPGKYLVCAVSGLDENAWQDPDTLRQLQPLSVAVDLAEGQQHELTLESKRVP